jgi:hypothetical protein
MVVEKEVPPLDGKDKRVGMRKKVKLLIAGSEVG